MPLTYQDYLRYYSPGSQSSEGNFTVGGDGQQLSQEQWNLLGNNDQWSRVNGGTLALMPDDPRYQALKPQVGGEAGREMWLRPGSMGQGVSQEHKGDGFFAHSRDQQTPGYQESVHPGDLRNEMIRNLLIVAGVGAGAGLAGVAEGAGGGAMSTSIGGGFGTGALGSGGTGASFGTAMGAEGLGAGLGSGSGSVPFEANYPGNQPWTPGAESAPSGQSSLFGNTPQGVIAPGMENTALADSWLINNGMSGMAGGNLTGLLSPGASGAVGNLLSSAINNPLRTYGQFQTIRGLLSGGNSGGRSNGSSSSQGKSGGSNGSGPAPNPNYWVNPYTLAQLQQTHGYTGG